jgi:ubiquinone/menaquinone biosynthesis C-methylase UbiE
MQEIESGERERTAHTGASAVQQRRGWISQEQADAIRLIDHFRQSEYLHLDLDALIDEYMQNFVAPLIALAGAPRSVADIGAGYGWLSFAFALGTDAAITMMEYDANRSRAAQQIAAILGIGHRIRWLVGSIAAIPLNDREIDAVYCVEVIEHTGVEQDYAAELCRITNDVLVITTPNKVFPIIKHDTVLPFCHWLPLNVRNAYSGMFNRRHLQHNNLFWSPRRLLCALDGFERQSRFLQFASHAQYRQAQDRLAQKANWFDAVQDVYFSAVAMTGWWSIYLLPNLASTFRRKIS